MRFTANLLDYTVDEASGKVLEGDSSEPVKFDEKWAFARAQGTSAVEIGGDTELELFHAAPCVNEIFLNMFSKPVARV